ncbi:diguanylate cyclase regulator RdcB family protein [Streptomyces bicolor]|uniref:diguanylate cyclase regulator RdcB family protein n=1 Tax=Streptomyces bicolor TaxID=66874 RepID=UPI0004E26A15|nr:diguanylate cyclase regulator RdcB family protein [Streptomyces bicolor]
MNPSEVARGVRLVDDRLLLEMLNDLHTADDLLRVAVREGFFARLLAQVTGRGRRRGLAITGGLVGAQRGTLAWLTSLTDRLAVTDLVVAEVMNEVAQVRARVDRLGNRLQWAEQSVRDLALVLAELAEKTGRGLAEHDERLRRVESRQAIDDAMRKWRHPRLDPALGWLPGAMLLAREVAAGPAGEFAASGHGTRVELEVVERMLQDPPTPWYDGVKPVADLLAAATRHLPSDDHRIMLAELLGEGLRDELAGVRGPLASALSKTALVTGMQGVAPEAAARTALRSAIGNGSRYVATSLTAEELLRQLVREQFAEAASRRCRLRARESA